MSNLSLLVREFFAILDTKEESNNGVEFSPVFISSCRIQLTARLNHILKEMKALSSEPQNMQELVDGPPHVHDLKPLTKEPK